MILLGGAVSSNSFIFWASPRNRNTAVMKTAEKTRQGPEVGDKGPNPIPGGPQEKKKEGGGGYKTLRKFGQSRPE